MRAAAVSDLRLEALHGDGLGKAAQLDQWQVRQLRESHARRPLPQVLSQQLQDLQPVRERTVSPAQSIRCSCSTGCSPPLGTSLE